MAMYDLNPSYHELAHCKSQNGKEAIQYHIRLASHYIVEYGKNTDDWPQAAILEVGKAARDAHEIVGTEDRKKKARETGGVNLADYW